MLDSKVQVQQSSLTKFNRSAKHKAKGAAKAVLYGLGGLVATPFVVLATLCKPVLNAGAKRYCKLNASQCNNELAAAQQIHITPETQAEYLQCETQLNDYAKEHHLTSEQAQQMFCIGSEVVKKVQAQTSGLPLQWDNGVTVDAANTVLCRAVLWYSMGKALQSEGGKIADEHTMVIQDPDHKLYKFFDSNPLVGNRPSKHDDDKVVDKQHKYLGLIPSGKPQQSCFTDTQQQLPGHGGACWFEKQVHCSGNNEPVGALLLSIKKVGRTDYLPKQCEQGQQGYLKPLYAANNHFNYVKSALKKHFSVQTDAGLETRHDDISSGRLKQQVYTPFLALLEQACAAGYRYNDGRGHHYHSAEDILACEDARSLAGINVIANDIVEYAEGCNESQLIVNAETVATKASAAEKQHHTPRRMNRVAEEVILDFGASQRSGPRQQRKQPSSSELYLPVTEYD